MCRCSDTKYHLSAINNNQLFANGHLFSRPLAVLKEKKKTSHRDSAEEDAAARRKWMCAHNDGRAESGYIRVATAVRRRCRVGSRNIRAAAAENTLASKVSHGMSELRERARRNVVPASRSPSSLSSVSVSFSLPLPLSTLLFTSSLLFARRFCARLDCPRE